MHLVLSFMERESGHWACNSCEYKSNKKAHTKYHVQKHIEGFSHPCKTCEKVFKMRYSLRKHKCKYENVTSEVFEKYDEGDPTNITNETELTSNMIEHMGVLEDAIFENNITIDERERDVEIPDIVDKKIRTEDSFWNCGECSFISTNKAQSREHAVQHTGVYLHQCEVCSSFFKTRGSLLRHQCVKLVKDDKSKSIGEVKLIEDVSVRKIQLDTFETNTFEEDFQENVMDEYDEKPVPLW